MLYLSRLVSTVFTFLFYENVLNSVFILVIKGFTPLADAKRSGWLTVKLGRSYLDEAPINTASSHPDIFGGVNTIGFRWLSSPFLLCGMRGHCCCATARWSWFYLIKRPGAKRINSLQADCNMFTAPAIPRSFDRHFF